jgi:hypothetical protein
MTRKRTSETDLVVSSGAAAPVRRKASARPRAKRAAEQTELLAPAAAQDAVALQADAAQEMVATQADATRYLPSREEIAALAYSYWEARGCQGGCPDEDWIRAEEELRNRSASIAIA